MLKGYLIHKDTIYPPIMVQNLREDSEKYRKQNFEFLFELSTLYLECLYHSVYKYKLGAEVQKKVQICTEHWTNQTYI